MPCPDARLGGHHCALEHWCPALGGRREPVSWRAPCPVCRACRAIEYDVPALSVRWTHHCGCPRAEVRAALARLLGPCLSAPRAATRPSPLSPDQIIALARTDMPPQSLRLALLRAAGISTTEALDMLGIPRQSRPRVIAGCRDSAT